VGWKDAGEGKLRLRLPYVADILRASPELFMVKILSQSGSSLADVYNVDGSIAAIDQLEASEIQLVHEMGDTIFSERASSTVRRRETAALLQNATFDELITDLPSGVTRILGVQVLVDFFRIAHAAVSVRDPVANREFPIWLWETGVDTNHALRVADQAAAANTGLLQPLGGTQQTPSILIGANQPQSVPDIAFRGLTTAFGAGDVTAVLLLYLSFSAIGGIGSRGLPVPSW